MESQVSLAECQGVLSLIIAVTASQYTKFDTSSLQLSIHLKPMSMLYNDAKFVRFIVKCEDIDSPQIINTYP